MAHSFTERARCISPILTAYLMSFPMLKTVGDRKRTPGGGGGGKAWGPWFEPQLFFLYTIPRIKNIFDAKVFLSVDNAFLLTSYPGNNPEVNAARTNNSNDVISPGKDLEAYPVPRTMSVGIRVNF